MWILECDGDDLEHKRVWLRPGKSYLFGRTHPEGGRYAGFAIMNRSVSRKHLRLSVTKVQPGQSTDADTRSELTLEDMGGRTATQIDGERYSGQKKVLTNDEHVFQLGNYEKLFRIKWLPVVLAFTFPSKETKGGKDPLIPIRSRLEDVDIKMVIPYVVDKTTHVVAGKRNTAKCLQALVNAKYIVDDSFLDAVVYAATPGDLDVPESLSPLEEDFDKHWPDPADHLPAPGKEPGQRPTELFKPNAARKDVFEGYTFLLFDQRQFDNLEPPITNGGGKALLYELQSQKTTASELVDYAHGIAKDHNCEESKVILVRCPGEKGHEDWADKLQREIIVILKRELIEQNEFLDAILINDATKLQRALPGFGTRKSNAISTSLRPSVEEQDNPAPARPNPPPTGRRGRTRGPVKSAFEGFDDGFDPSQVTTFKRSVSASSTGRKPLTRHAQHDEQQDVIMEEGPEDDAPDTPHNPRKRQAEDDALLDEMLPAAAALKRRKIEEEKARARGESVGSPPVPAKDKAQSISKKKKKKEIDIQEELQRQKDVEESRAREDEESLQQTLDGMTVDDMRKLAVVETLNIPDRARPAPQTNGVNDRWDDRWNGRKNFKKFRRQGDPGTSRRGQTVIVPLVEVKKRGHGLGASYHTEAPTTSRPSKSSRRERELQHEDEQEESRSQSYASARSTQNAEIPPELQATGEHEVVDVDAPRATRLQDKKGSADQRMNKRPASTNAERGGPKKQRTLRVRSDSDSEDEMKFKFRKGKRR